MISSAFRVHMQDETTKQNKRQFPPCMWQKEMASRNRLETCNRRDFCCLKGASASGSLSAMGSLSDYDDLILDILEVHGGRRHQNRARVELF